MLRTAFSPVSLLIWMSMAATCIIGQGHFVMGQDVSSALLSAEYSSAQPTKLPEDIEQVLWWLPEETETVLVSKGKVPIKKSQILAVQQERRPPGPHIIIPTPDFVYPTPGCGFEDMVAMNCTEPLMFFPALHRDSFKMRNRVIWSFYGQRTASLFVKAVWWEKDATRETCDIVLFRDKTPARIIELLAPFRYARKSIHELPILVVDLNQGRHSENNGHVPFDLNELGRPPRTELRYLAVPRPNVFIATTSSEMMKVILGRMKQRGENRALPANLPEWQYIDSNAVAWGLRHYRQASVAKDSMSMLKWDPGAKGLVFFGGNKPSHFIGLKYVSSSEDSGIRFSRMQADWFGVKDISLISPMQRFSKDCVVSRTRINVPHAELERGLTRTLSAEYTRLCMNIMYLPWLGFSNPRIAIRQGE